MAACSMPVEILFVGMDDLEGGPHSKARTDVCLSDTCCQLMWLNSIVKLSI